MTFSDEINDMRYIAEKIELNKIDSSKLKYIKQLQMMAHSLDVVLSERIKMEEATYTSRS